MKIPFVLLDTFTAEKFKGNPTPVCLLQSDLDDELMHALAKEFNSPVFAFVEPEAGDNLYPIRYFTTTGEIPACGHATLAAANVIFQVKKLVNTSFTTIEAIELKASLEDDIVFLQYPKFKKAPFDIPSRLLASLNITDYTTAFFCEELKALFIELNDASELVELSPNFEDLRSSSNKIKEVVITSKSNRPEYDFLLRSFCPWIGIDEDPVTGSVHSVLAHHWRDNLQKEKLIAYQASHRGGQVYLKPKKNWVELGGKSVVLLKGELEI